MMDGISKAFKFEKNHGQRLFGQQYQRSSWSGVLDQQLVKSNARSAMLMASPK
jgi:hypothetical protein